MNRATGQLFLLHFFGNALVLWLAYYWLGIGESDGAHLAWSAIVLIAAACAAVWMHGAAMVLFRPGANRDFAGAAKTALRHVPALLAVAVIAALIYSLLAYWNNSFGHRAFVIGSYLTLKFRKPVSPESVLRWYRALIWIVRWLVVPGVLVPLAASVASFGWRGFRVRAPGRIKNIVYSLVVCALLLAGVLAPLKLILWVPQISAFAWQMASFLARLGAGYLLFVAALLLLEFVTSAGKPRATQASTAA